MASSPVHEPVLLDEVVEYLHVVPGGSYIDCTAGAGGHTAKIAQLAAPDGNVIACDSDNCILELARARLKALEEQQGKLARTRFVHSSYVRISDLCNLLPTGKPDGILFDFGCSSLQLDDPERGFSFRYDAPLDMRFDKQGPAKTAADVIATLSEMELADVFYRYGDERRSQAVARRIVEERRKKPIRTTKELKDIVESVTGRRTGKIAGATRVFQALRIFVNDELGNIEQVLPRAQRALKEGGRIVAITFHSTEDRIVKQFFKGLEVKGEARLLTKKPVTPKAEELRRNPRARSAKLRAIRKDI
ncbi:MAG: 16S rRNA (cytosine(1402)-N(4))-methyltransferase RsmH [Planctomycetota bacterium]|nr:16S rRNA (cytosine(1402)-N(4))-methyltransferase RsmH [Planctomycetota bacterium]